MNLMQLVQLFVNAITEGVIRGRFHMNYMHSDYFMNDDWVGITTFLVLSMVSSSLLFLFIFFGALVARSPIRTFRSRLKSIGQIT